MPPRRPFLFIANNPGSLMAMLPVIALSSESRVRLTSTVEKLVPENFVPYELLSHETGLEKAKELLKVDPPCAVITGSSVPHLPGGNLEHFFRMAAREMDIPSALILDHWCNYAGRFAWTRPDGEKISTLPDLVCAMDERAKREMVAEGVPESVIRVTGQPAFDAIHRRIPQMGALRSAARAQLGFADSKRVIGFVSEPVHGDHGSIRGYDEFKVFRLLADCLKKIGGETALLVKLHPREAEEKYEPLSSAPGFDLKIIRQLPSASFAASCDLIVGMTSLLLLEASLLGKSAFSLQPDAEPSAEWCRLIHPIPVLRSSRQIEALIRDFSVSGAPVVPDPPFYSETNAARKVLDCLVELVRGR